MEISNDYFKGAMEKKKGSRHMIFISSIEIGIYTSKFLLPNYRNRDVYSTQAVGMYGIIIFLDLFFDKAIVFIF